MTKRYNWKQDTEGIHISFEIDPKEETKIIKYKILNKNIKITYNDELILEGELYDWIKKGSDYFVINDDSVDFYMDKLYTGWWDYLIKGEQPDQEELTDNIEESVDDPEVRETIDKIMGSKENK